MLPKYDRFRWFSKGDASFSCALFMLTALIVAFLITLALYGFEVLQ